MLINLITKSVATALLTASTALAPCYAFAQQIRYIGQTHRITDATGLPLTYRYTQGDTGQFIQANLNAQATEYNVYLAPNTQSCAIGQLCEQRLGNNNLTRYSYIYNPKNNPYRALSEKRVYQFNPESGHYILTSQIINHYNLNHQLTFSQQTNWLNGQKSVLTIQNDYDILGRLANSEHNQKMTRYHYDANSNMTDRAGGQHPLSLSVNGIDQAISINGQSIHFNPNGSQLTTATTPGALIFNARNQLVGYQQNHQYTVYRYTANGIRWQKAQPSQSIEINDYVNGNQLLNRIETQQGYVQGFSHYLLANGHTARVLTGQNFPQASVNYYLLGRQESVIGHFDQKGQLTNTQQYAAYGRLLSSKNLFPKRGAAPAEKFGLTLQTDPFGYDGEQRDPTTGLIHLRARDYNPITARFISQDSYLLSNRYAFTPDPNDFLDSSGHQSFMSWWHHNNQSMETSALFGILALPVAEFGIPVNIAIQMMGTMIISNAFLSGSRNLKSMGISTGLSTASALVSMGLIYGLNAYFPTLNYFTVNFRRTAGALSGMLMGTSAYGSNYALNKILHRNTHISGWGFLSAGMTGAMFGAMTGWYTEGAANYLKRQYGFGTNEDSALLTNRGQHETYIRQNESFEAQPPNTRRESQRSMGSFSTTRPTNTIAESAQTYVEPNTQTNVIDDKQPPSSVNSKTSQVDDLRIRRNSNDDDEL